MKNWGKMEMRPEVSYQDILLAKLFRETDSDFACLQTNENNHFYQERKSALYNYMQLKKQDIEKPKSLKPEEKLKMMEEMKKIPYRKFPLRNETKYYNFQDVENISCFNYLYFFPQVYKYTMSQKRLNYINIFDFILNKNTEVKKFNSRLSLDIPYEKKQMATTEFADFSLNYLFADEYKDSLERKILKYETDFISKGELMKFRQLSLGHSIVNTIDRLISSDVLNSDKYLNLVCTGGVCNTKNIIKSVNRDVQSLLTISQDANKQDFIKTVNTRYEDYSTSFYKGANFISKLPDLENIMISRHQYYDNGSDYLSYCYI